MCLPMLLGRALGHGHKTAHVTCTNGAQTGTLDADSEVTG